MKTKLIFLCALFLIINIHAAESLKGNHFMATYKECDKEALTNGRAVMEILEKAAHLSGAMVMRSEQVAFTNGGFIAMVILSEGHASAHIYPQKDTCYVDFFTVGSHCSHVPFDKLLERYFKPMDSAKKVVAQR